MTGALWRDCGAGSFPKGGIDCRGRSRTTRRVFDTGRWSQPLRSGGGGRRRRGPALGLSGAYMRTSTLTLIPADAARRERRLADHGARHGRPGIGRVGAAHVGAAAEIEGTGWELEVGLQANTRRSSPRAAGSAIAATRPAARPQRGRCGAGRSRGRSPTAAGRVGQGDVSARPPRGARPARASAHGGKQGPEGQVQDALRASDGAAEDRP